MARIMALLFAVTTGVGVALALQQPAPTPPRPPCHQDARLVGPCQTIHGRLSAANGVGYLFWRVGTNRLMRVEYLARSLDDTISLAHKKIYADFLICPLTKSRPGIMQTVCVDTATRLVTKHDEFFGPEH